MIITLTTDFGLKDPFVGQMKGVILSMNHGASIVDLTHEIDPHAIQEAAFIVAESFRYFPSGTIHLAVVDPGVGSCRRAIIIEVDGHLFVGPDNGIFSCVITDSKPCLIMQIDMARFSLKEDSATFQGRDLFAPVAGRLSLGMRPDESGVPIDDPVMLSITKPVADGRVLHGEIIYIDRFGNCITSVKTSDLAGFGEPYHVVCKGRTARSARYYGEREEGQLGCLVNSSGFLEIFMHKGNASAVYGLRIGEKVDVVRAT